MSGVPQNQARHKRSHSRMPSHTANIQPQRSSSPSISQPSRTPSPHVRADVNGMITIGPSPASTASKTTELHERLPTAAQEQNSGVDSSTSVRKAPNAYQLRRKLSEPVTAMDAPATKHKPAALTLAPFESNIQASNAHGFPVDPNRPISQRPFSQHYPWPYDPSSYYNMARSPTVSNHPKPKAYPVGWEENGGLSRPVSMGGIDLPIPLTPLAPPVPVIPQQYRRPEENVRRPVEPPSPKVLYDHERDGIGGQVTEKKPKKQQQAHNQAVEQQLPAPQDTYEYVPEASPLSSLEELWEITTHGKPLRNRPQEPLKATQFAIPEGVYVLNMYRGAPLHAHQQHQMADGTIFTPEHFAFGPTPSNPFYTIQALPDALHPNNPTVYDPRHPETYFNDLLIMRRNPITNKDTSVLTMGLNPLAATSHRRRAILAASGQPKQISPTQGDELITLIYPKQAAMMAIDSSSIHVDERTGRIVGGDAQTMAREAVVRAAETECCRLSWDVARDRYYLYHPGVGNGGEVYLVIIDDGNYSRSQQKPGEASQSVGFDVPGGSKGSIKLINVDTSEAIVVLDFKSGLLFVNTMATRKIPSLYIVDVAVSTVLAVAVVEGRRIRDVKLLQSVGPAAFSGPSLAYPPAVVTVGGRGKQKMLGWDQSELDREEKSDMHNDNNKNGGVLDLAGMIVNGIITVIAWIVGFFWAIGAALGKLFTRGKKDGNGTADIEAGVGGYNGAAARGVSNQPVYGYAQR